MKTTHILHKKWILLALGMIVIVLSCKKTSTYSFTKDIQIEISVSDYNGSDLLNPEFFNYYNKDSIKIYYIINNQPTEIYNPLLDAPRNFYIGYKKNRFRMQLSPNYNNSEESPITLIQWNSFDTDTLRCNFTYNMDHIICTQIWFNNEMVWEATDADPTRSFEIIK